MPVLRIVTVLLALGAGAGTAFTNQAAWAQGTLLGSPLPSRAALGRFKLTRAWWGNATLNPSRDKVLFLTLDDDKLYVQASSGIVTAFDSETGRRLWASQLGRQDEYTFPATVNSDVLLIVSGMSLYALNKRTGATAWTLRLPRQASTSPVADDENIYIGSLDGSMSAFDLRKIRQLYNEDLLPQWSYETIRWRYNTGKEIRVPAVSTGRDVNFASMNGSLYSVSFDRRDLKFQFETDAPISAPIARYKDSLLVASEDFRIYSIDSNTGAIHWNFVAGLKILKAPQVVEDDLYLMTERGGMFRLSAKNGQQYWHNPQAQSFIAASPTVVYASDRQQNLVMVSHSDGSILGALPLPQFTIRLANDRTDRLYMATSTGFILALHEQGLEEPRIYKFPERQPIMPEFASDDEEAATTTTPPESTEPGEPKEEPE